MQHIPDERDLRNLLLTISYDGRQFHGWQIQQNAYTVQEAFQTALTKIIGEGFDLKGCSRTDTGVHANMYCISLKTTHPIPPERLLQEQRIHLQDMEQRGSISVSGGLRASLPISARRKAAERCGSGVCR